MSKYAPHILQWADDLVAGKATPDQVIRQIQERYPKTSTAVTVTSYVKGHVLDKLRIRSDRLTALLSTVPPHPKVQDPISQMTCREIIKMQKDAQNGNYTGHSDIDAMLASLPLVPSWVHQLKISRDLSAVAEAAAKATTSRVLQLGDVQGLFNWLDSIDPETSSPFQCIIACCIYTGRRTAELTLTGRFDPVEGEPFAATFSGQLKKKMAANHAYKIPLLAPYERVTALIRSFRSRLDLPTDVSTSHKDDATRYQIHQRLQHTLNTVMHRELDAFIHEKSSKYKVHDLRAIYAYLTYEIFVPEGITFPGWIHRILGHENLNVSMCYNRVRHSQHDVIELIRTRFL